MNVPQPLQATPLWLPWMLRSRRDAGVDHHTSAEKFQTTATLPYATPASNSKPTPLPSPTAPLSRQPPLLFSKLATTKQSPTRRKSLHRSRSRHDHYSSPELSDLGETAKQIASTEEPPLFNPTSPLLHRIAQISRKKPPLPSQPPTLAVRPHHWGKVPFPHLNTYTHVLLHTTCTQCWCSSFSAPHSTCSNVNLARLQLPLYQG